MIQYLAQNDGMALRESLFYVTNGTANTGIVITSLASSFAATKGFLNVYNSASATASPGQNQWIIPIFLRMRATRANTGASRFTVIGSLDNKDRYSSGGSGLSTLVVVPALDTATGYASRAAKATIKFGSLTLAAASTSVKRVMNMQLTTNVAAAHDTLEIWFGPAFGPSTFASGKHTVRYASMIWIGRGCSLALHNTTAGNQSQDIKPEVEFYYAEMGHPKFN